MAYFLGLQSLLPVQVKQSSRTIDELQVGLQIHHQLLILLASLDLSLRRHFLRDLFYNQLAWILHQQLLHFRNNGDV